MNQPNSGNRILRRVSIGTLIALAIFATLFAVGETVADPGGLAGAALSFLWVGPMVVLAVVAWRAPDRMGWVLAGLTAVVAMIDMSAIVVRQGWRDFEFDHGPVRAVATLAVAGVLAVFAIKRARLASVLLIALGGAPLVVSLAAARSAPLRAIAFPLVVLGLLLLLSTFSGDQPARLASTRPTRSGHGAPGRHRPRTAG